MRLRIKTITWHPRYRYTIGGLSVNGRRKRLFFETEAAAQEELRNLEIKARRQGQAGLDIPDALRAMAIDCAQRLRPHGKTIADATTFLLHHLAAEQSAHVGALVDDYLRALERGRLSERHLIDVRRRLGRFQEAFTGRPVRTITARELEGWLYSLHGNGADPKAQTLVNWRAALGAFFGWLLRQKLVDFNPVAAVSKPKVVREPPGIWAPEDLEKLLKVAAAELVPALAVGAFAGLRTAELLRLSWSEIDLGRHLIEVKAAKAKTAARRFIPIEPNLRAWLEPHAGSTGPIWPKGWRSFYEATAKLSRELDLKWPENGLRHSFASYHLARYENAEKLAGLMGHTNSRVLYAHYRELVRPDDATRYWEIRP